MGSRFRLLAQLWTGASIHLKATMCNCSRSSYSLASVLLLQVDSTRESEPATDRYDAYDGNGNVGRRSTMTTVTHQHDFFLRVAALCLLRLLYVNPPKGRPCLLGDCVPDSSACATARIQTFTQPVLDLADGRQEVEWMRRSLAALRRRRRRRRSCRCVTHSCFSSLVDDVCHTRA